jgi:hypothetical protein
MNRQVDKLVNLSNVILLKRQIEEVTGWNNKLMKRNFDATSSWHNCMSIKLRYDKNARHHSKLRNIFFDLRLQHFQKYPDPLSHKT